MSDFPPRLVALDGEPNDRGLKRDEITKINAGNDWAFRKAVPLVLVS
jgi:hypothetical protein